MKLIAQQIQSETDKLNKLINDAVEKGILVRAKIEHWRGGSLTIFISCEYVIPLD